MISVGLAPGQTNLLATVDDIKPGPLDIALLVGAGERHGAAATTWACGRLVGNSARLRRVDLPGHGRPRLYRADLPTSTRSAVTSPCRCVPVSASTLDSRPRCLPA
jgi:hypothetical protein